MRLQCQSYMHGFLGKGRMFVLLVIEHHCKVHFQELKKVEVQKGTVERRRGVVVSKYLVVISKCLVVVSKCLVVVSKCLVSGSRK